MPTPDQIFIANLELQACIGVTLTEQAHKQRLTVSLAITPRHGFDSLGDDLEKTVNYSSVCKAVVALTAGPARQLIETLAREIADLVLTQFDCVAVEVELRKYVLPDTDYVAVHLSRQRPAKP